MSLKMNQWWLNEDYHKYMLCTIVSWSMIWYHLNTSNNHVKSQHDKHSILKYRVAS